MSLDASIMEIADDIAYGVHDLEDSIALKLICEDQFRKAITKDHCSRFLSYFKERDTDGDLYEVSLQHLFDTGKQRKRYIGRLVGHFIDKVNLHSNTEDDFQEPLVRFRAKMPTPYKEFLDSLKNLVSNVVIKSPSVQHLEFKGQKMVVSVFEAFASDPKLLLPLDAYRDYKLSDRDNRVICDHVAGMTDGFLLKTFDRLFSPRMGSVFDKL